MIEMDSIISMLNDMSPFKQCKRCLDIGKPGEKCKCGIYLVDAPNYDISQVNVRDMVRERIATNGQPTEKGMGLWIALLYYDTPKTYMTLEQFSTRVKEVLQ
jgi:hypothetical protein